MPDSSASVSVRVSPLPRRSAFSVKGWSPDAELPGQVRATAHPDVRLLSLGPGHWLLISEVLDAEQIRQRFQSECAEQNLALTELTDAIATLEIAGPDARDLLSKGCGLDLHPTGFPPGQSAQTRFAALAVTLDCIDASRFELYVSRSYADYLHAWLIDAAAEFGS